MPLAPEVRNVWQKSSLCLSLKSHRDFKKHSDHSEMLRHNLDVLHFLETTCLGLGSFHKVSLPFVLIWAPWRE